MKAIKPADIRKLSPEEIRAKISDARDELMKLRFQQVSGQLTDPSRLNILRK
ncbi:MAG: 50S ribosomal protein L29, partial [Anaerolineales bacterium]|nr:50S ribosomal protein L29 [Anaerolineales bacterium]